MCFDYEMTKIRALIPLYQSHAVPNPRFLDSRYVWSFDEGHAESAIVLE